jgi:uncharacterized membrane protein
MSNLFALSVPDENTALQMVNTFKQLQSQNLIKIEDAAIVTRAPNGKPKIRQMHDLVGVGALGGAFWGMLIGLLFLVPLLGLAVGAAAGAISGSLADVGISDDFIRNVGNAIKPGQAGLFLLVSNAVQDKVLDAIKGYQFQLIQSSLSQEDENKLRDTLGAIRTA